MSKPESTPERIKFIPERNPGEPAGELIEGEVIHTSESGEEKVAITDGYDIYVILLNEDKPKVWEAVNHAFSLDEMKERIAMASRLIQFLKEG